MSLISEDENSVLLKGDGTAKDAPSDGTAASLATENSYKNEKSLRPVYQRNSRVSTQVLLSRIGSFLFASALALFVLATKRDDLDELLSLLPFNLDIHRTPSQQQVWESTAVPGTPEKDYIVCTRQKGGIYTVDESMPNIQCLVVNTEGYIVNTGSIDSVKEAYPQTRPHFLPKGSIVVPGMVDSHVHLLEYGWSRTLNLDGAKTIEEVVQRVREYVIHRDATRTPGEAEDEWIEGVGWDQNKWEDWTGGFPTHEHLDADPVLRGKPIILFRTDLHVVWVSGRALELCGKLPKKVTGGEIIRDAAGMPTGIFVDLAQLLVPRPAWTTHQMREFYQRVMRDALGFGLTAVHDAMTKDPMIEFYKQIADEGSLPIRMHLMANRDYGYWGDEIERFSHYGRHGRLHLRSVKLIADGAIGSWGAVMYEPYTDNPSTSGLFVTPLKELRRNIPRYLDLGWQVNVHCIGDRANGEVLNIFEKALRGRKVSVLRPRIEHAQIFRHDDIARVGRLGLIASIQPKHATSDMVYADARLGERAKSAYVYRSLLDAGARIAMGSDMPVESPNPLVGFHAAVTRLDANGTSPHGPDGWYSEQKLTREEALKGMTLDATYASFSEHEVGSLVVGKRADFVVLDKDIMTIDARQVLETRVLATVVDGVVQYGSL